MVILSAEWNGYLLKDIGSGSVPHQMKLPANYNSFVIHYLLLLQTKMWSIYRPRFLKTNSDLDIVNVKTHGLLLVFLGLSLQKDGLPAR